jgi:outer membrane receptor protein involved in Fe transport
MKKTHRVWVGLGTLALSTVVCAQQAMQVDIDSQPLDRALNAWATQTGYQVLIPSDRVARGRVAPAVKGTYTPERALKVLLASSDLKYEFVNSRTVTIRNTASSQTTTDSPQQAATSPLVLAQSRPRETQEAASTGTTPPNNTEATGSEGIEQVIVTAQKRSERLQDIPISITAIGERDIEHRGIVDRNDYLRSVPGVNLIDQGPGLNTVMMRGAYGDYFRTGPTVGIYLGDVPLTGNALGGSADVVLDDIERIEVLRGPQGTLYGSNSLSGAVRYIPRAPDLVAFGSHVEAGYSSTSRLGGDNTKIQGIVNIPLITDQLAVRAVAYRHHNDGYYRNVAGSDAALQTAAAAYGAQNLAVSEDNRGASTYTGGRVSALWRPIDVLSFTLTYLKQETSQEDRPFEMTQFGAYELSEYSLGGPAAGKDALKVDLNVISLTGELELGWASLLSSSSWIDQDSIRNWDIGSLLPRPRAGLVAPITQLSVTNASVFSQELRLTSSGDSRLRYVVGLYYEDNEQPYRQPTYFAGDPALNPYPAVKLWDTSSGRWAKQKAEFGEISYALTGNLKATVGGRHFDYDTRFKLQNFDAVAIVSNSLDDNRASESGNTFKAGLDFKPTDNTLIYAKWSQGFRLGRPLNTTQIRTLCDRDNDGLLDGSNISSTLSIVASDTLDSYELGSKLTAQGGRTALNVAVYNNEWTDVPVTYTPPGCLSTTTINGGEARARGVELEGTVRPAPGLQLGLGVGYVDTELTKTTSAGNKGDRMNFTPKINGNFSAEYGFNIAGNETFLRSDYSYYGNSYTGTGERGDKVGGYGLVNLAGGVRIKQMDLQLQISNLLSSEAFNTVNPGSGLGGFPSRYALRVRPRTVGLTLGYTF